MNTIDVKYSTTVTVSGGRQGRAVSEDGVLDVQLRTPKLNGIAEGTNPEQLFGAAWGACLQSALGAVARKEGVDVSGSTVKVVVGQGPDEDGTYGIAAKIEIEIPAVDRETAERLVDAAHQLCPYSRAVAGNIPLELTVA